MTTLLAPPVPADVDLRDYPAMLLDVVRLRDSELAGHPDGNCFRDNVLSWCVAWHQQPAGSLPDDDVSLAKLLGYGRDIKGWKKARAKGSLRGWIKCSDGRLYHPVVAEKAIEAWRSKLRQQWLKECARAKKHNQRNENKITVPEFDDWLRLGCPQGHSLPVPGTNQQRPEGQAPPVPKDNATLSPGKHAPIEENGIEGNTVNLSVPSVRADKPPGMPTDEIIFGYGVPMLTNAGTPEKQARSFLGGLRKAHGDTALIDKLRDCMRAKPLQPLEWLAAALPPGGTAPPRRQTLTESRAATIAGLTGATNPKEPRNERDITADAQRLPAA